MALLQNCKVKVSDTTLFFLELSPVKHNLFAVGWQHGALSGGGGTKHNTLQSKENIICPNILHLFGERSLF